MNRFVVVLVILVFLLAGCQSSGIKNEKQKHIKPIPASVLANSHSEVFLKTNIQVMTTTGEIVSIPVVYTNAAPSNSERGATKKETRAPQLLIITSNTNSVPAKTEIIIKDGGTASASVVTLKEEKKKKNLLALYYCFVAFIGATGWLFIYLIKKNKKDKSKITLTEKYYSVSTGASGSSETTSFSTKSDFGGNGGASGKSGWPMNL